MLYEIDCEPFELTVRTEIIPSKSNGIDYFRDKKKEEFIGMRASGITDVKDKIYSWFGDRITVARVPSKLKGISHKIVLRVKERK
jgi:hypothetical protein